jgi:hypothetical protein
VALVVLVNKVAKKETNSLAIALRNMGQQMFEALDELAFRRALAEAAAREPRFAQTSSVISSVGRASTITNRVHVDGVSRE